MKPSRRDFLKWTSALVVGSAFHGLGKAQSGTIKIGFVNPTIFDCLSQELSVSTGWCRHLKIETCACCTFGCKPSKPIGHDETFEAPFIAQNVL